jgi:hypothetical protein
MATEQRIPVPGGEVTLTINGTKTEYHLFYQSSTQSASLYPVDTNGQKLTNSSPLYVDGVWQRAEVQKDPSLLPTQRTNYDDVIKTAVRSYHRTTSGGAGPAPAWTQTPAQGTTQAPGTPNQNSQTPQQGNAPSNVFDFLNAARQFIDTIKDPLDGITGPNGWGVQSDKYDFALDDAFNKFAQGGALRYPLDLLGNQDRLVISCYAYQPPYAANFDAGLNDLFNGLQRTSAFKKQIKPNIYLPMPKDAKDSNAASWKEDNFSALSQAAVADIRQNFAAYGGALLGGNIVGNIVGAGNVGSLATRLALYARLVGAAGNSSALQTSLGPILTSMLAGSMGFDISPETILSRAGGIVQNSNTELMFRGVGPMRSFTFTYRMSARGPTEANVIRTIIRALKQWSAPRKIAKISTGAQTVGKAGSPSYFLGTPHVFQLKYVTNNGNLIAGVNRFKPCALTRISTNYTPDGEWNAFEGGQPVSIEMQLEFTELEPIYNTDYSNEADPSRPDLIPLTFGTNSSFTDVGY